MERKQHDLTKLVRGEQKKLQRKTSQGGMTLRRSTEGRTTFRRIAVPRLRRAPAPRPPQRKR